MDRYNSTTTLFGGSSGAHSARRTGGGKKRPRWRKTLLVIVVVLAVLAGGYLTAVYSQIPFIRDLRTMYIETAMSTFSHHWLATAFIPADVVNKVVEDMDKALQDNLIDESNIPEQKPPEEKPPVIDQPVVTPPTPNDTEQQPPEPPDNGLESLLAQFPELDEATIPDSIEDFHGLQISDIVDMGIKTTAGDPVWCIDSPNNLIILEVSGTGYKGKLAIVKDSAQVVLRANKRNGRGSTVTELVQESGGVLGINASGFIDPEGKGRGNEGVGLIIEEGVVVHSKTGGSYQICGLDYDNNLRMGTKVDTDTLRSAVQFMPIVILNGERKNPGSFTSNQPRTVIGQTSDKSMLLLIIDGRQPLHSIGASVSTCADILMRYDCYNAMNMDGGSSSSMTYMDQMITKTSSPAANGRYVPDAWVVLPPDAVATGTGEE